ncbi:pectinesterase [Sarracenia purpurea var. burkii]
MEEGKKRITIISICSLILVAMVVAVTIGVSQNTDSQSYNHHDITTSGKAIKNICEPTDYKEVCVQSLTTAAGNTSDPKELIKVAFQVAMEQMQQAVQNSTLLQELQTDPRTKDAVGDCQDLANSALNDLKRSIGKMGEVDASSIDELLANLKTWLSGAITYQETCLDGFENTTGDAGEKMKEYLKIGMQLTSNALAMVTEISSTLQSLDIQGYSRRLLWEDIPVMGHGSEFPSWVDSGSRKLLTAAPAKIKPDLVVAKDGSGKYRTINEALGDIPENSNKTFVLYIKEGVYDERVQFNRTLTNLMVVGDGATKTRITGSLNFIDGTSTFKTATVGGLANSSNTISI